MPFLRLGQLSALGEQVPAVLAHGGQHREPGPRPAVLLSHEAAVDERAQRLDGVLAAQAVGHPLDRIEAETGAEHPQAEEQVPLGIREQLGAPVDRRPQRALAFGEVARPPTSSGQRVVEPFDERRRRQHAQASGGELESERTLSSAPQIATTCAALSSVSSKSGLTARARSDEELRGVRRREGPERQFCSPRTRSRIRLVASTDDDEPASRALSFGAASTTCSTLSSTRSIRRPAARRRIFSASGDRRCRGCRARSRRP